MSTATYRSSLWSGICFVLLAALCWAFIGPIGRYSLEQGATPLEAAFWRAVFGSVFFWLHGLRSGLVVVPFRAAAACMLFGIVGIGGLFGTYLVAVQQVGAALSSVLLYTAPAWVAVFSRLVYKEKLSPAKTAAVILAVGGAALACSSGGGLPQGASRYGLLMGLASGLAYSAHYIFGAHYLRRYSPVSLYCWALPAGALILLPFVEFSAKSPSSWMSLLLLGAVCTFGAYRAYGEGLKRLPPTTASVLAAMEPIIASLLAWWWWQELFSPLGWVGAALVVAAALLIVGTTRRAEETPPPRTAPQGN